ncbi:MAG TPA: hypothetical protein VNB59_07105 [Solirubrobacterales bacterium]|jgi:hypothetical protein|nr:hypothetical protein [Solirubrobacterales bacterium]
MPRAIVYEPSEVQAEYAALIKDKTKDGLRVPVAERMELLADARGQAEAPGDPPPVKDDGVSGKDDYLAKIAKYVPAETITLTTLAFAAIAPNGNDVWWVVGAGAFANLLYLFSTSLAATTTPLPRWHFYLLSIVAYAFWAAAIIGPVGEKVGISGDKAEIRQTFVLALAAFVVPALDSLGTHLPTRLKKTTPAPQPAPAGGG